MTVNELQLPPPLESAPDSFEAELIDASVLVIDDEPGMRNFLYKALIKHCARVDVSANTDEASALLDQYNYDVIVLDNIMPHKSGLEWLAEQQRIGLYSDAILMTAYADLDTAIAAIRAGASDFLLKPFKINQVINAIAQSLARSSLRRQNAVLRRELAAGPDLLRHRDALLGSSDEIHTVCSAIERAAATSAQIVVRGEVGAGKQIAARMLHARSARAHKAFVWLQCYGMREEVFQAHLFGTLDGASRDEASGQNGMLQDAAGGTLYLEDVEMLSASCQNLLVELLTTGRYRPIGAERSLALDACLVCSSTRPLREAVQEGFRTDLYYLLNVVEIVLPPLRERVGDIVELAEFFIEKLSRSMGLNTLTLTPGLRRRLMAHPWPGNVMELRNTVERALIHGNFDTLLEGPLEGYAAESLAVVEQRHILAVLEACGGNRAEAARQLGVARKTIDRKCQAWGL